MVEIRSHNKGSEDHAIACNTVDWPDAGDLLQYIEAAQQTKRKVDKLGAPKRHKSAPPKTILKRPTRIVLKRPS
jgi:hypothetical protein